ncbi:MAG: helix-hairpin-helix domain-containing protein, partial [Candidatus Thorarchaeota archaeon]
MADEFDQQNDDDGTEEEEGTEDIEEKTPPSQDTKLTTISGVGPKTAEKLKAAGYDTIRKVAEAEPESLSQAVPGLSIAKAESIIEEAATLIEMTATQVERAAPTPSKIRKKKSEEAEPVRIEFPKAEEGGRTT